MNSPEPGLRRVLVANRGEIAVRVTRTCRVLGIGVVAVHSPSDETAPHVAGADVAIPVDDYLDVEAMVEAARSTGCDAVHPGYGFLAENPEFARAVREAGLTFVGPAPEAMELMGNKTASRRSMREAGVPVVPGSPTGTVDELAEHAREIGYPVIVKAVAGGGGKGMHVVEDAERLPRALEAAGQESQQAFGDDRLYLEKLLEDPRHVEIQVFGDAHGRVVALGERECSIQRRHQKIVEESPSPAVDEELRARMSAAAIAAAGAVGYEGAGTVEFLLTPGGDFYFLEMNTRLQVEHPVTECVTGLDLVRMQLEVADGAALGELLGGIELVDDALTGRQLTGHAVECRVYAEDPAVGHLPQSGRLLAVREPSGPGVRVDSALQEGREVTPEYDPMLAKLIAHGRSREAAVERVREALERFVVLGVTTNIDYLQDVVSHPAFLEGELSTGFLDAHMPEWSGSGATPLALAATALPSSGTAPTLGRGADGGATADPWRRLGRFRLGGGRDRESS